MRRLCTTLGVSLWAALAAVLTASATGQVITTPGITGSLSLTWEEDPAFSSNGNGILEPGERALILLQAAFSGQYTEVSFSPPVGGYSSGVIVEMTRTLIDITSPSPDSAGLYNNGITNPPSSSVGPNANAAGTAGYGVRQGWRAGSSQSNGHPAPNGFVHIEAGQFFFDPTVFNPENPVANLDRLGWAPASYSPRTVTFRITPNVEAGQQIMGLGLVAGNGAAPITADIPFNSVSLGSVSIPIAPAPGGVAVLGTAFVAAARRRR